MHKELIEKVHSKLLKIIDENCRGISFQRLKLNKVSEKIFDLEIIVDGIAASALIDANLPRRYSNMKITYSDRTSSPISYGGNSDCWKTSARMYLK